MKSKGYGRKQSWPNSRCHPGICLEALKKATNDLCHDDRFPGRDINPDRPEYEVGMLTARPRSLVKQYSHPFCGNMILIQHYDFGIKYEMGVK
jgi:hypothetical protein